MSKLSVLSLMCFIVVLTACGAPSFVQTPPVGNSPRPSTPTTQTFLYTDAQAEQFAQQVATLEATSQSRPTPEKPFVTVQKLGIDLTKLGTPLVNIGNCYSVATYILSKSYELVIDDNACFPGTVIIRKRASSSQ